MRKALLDTDMLSEVLKGRDATVTQRAHAYGAEHEAFTVASVTVMEIVEGLHRRRMDERLTAFLETVENLEVLPFDSASAVVAGRVAADLLRSGQGIGRVDPMIAAVALVNGLSLVTGNRRHYARIVELGHPLDLDDWRDEAPPPMR